MAVGERQKLDMSTLRAEVSEAPVVEAPVAEAAPLIGREVVIHVRCSDLAKPGELTADVVSRVPDMEVKAFMLRAEARLCGGTPFHALALDRQRWVRRVARISCQLVDAPKWVLDRAAEDDALAVALEDQLTTHEYLFFHPGAASSGATQSGTTVAVESALDGHLDKVLGKDRPVG